VKAQRYKVPQLGLRMVRERTLSLPREALLDHVVVVADGSFCSVPGAT
jgi:hypothetical protein